MDKESIRRITAGYKLAYGEANHLIRSLMHALIVADGDHVEEDIDHRRWSEKMSSLGGPT